MGAERRISERYPIREPLRAKYETWSDFLRVFSHNISEQGIFLESNLDVEVGGAVWVEVVAPAGESLLLEGRIVHVVTQDVARWGDKPAGFGVAFEQIPDSQARALQRLVDVARQKT